VGRSHYRKHSGSFRSQYRVCSLMDTSLTRLGFIVLACSGQSLIQAQQVNYSGLKTGAFSSPERTALILGSPSEPPGRST
jgi:hypothetical protein